MSGSRPKRRYQIGLGGIVYIVVAIFIGMAAINSQANLLFWTFGLMLASIMVSGFISGFMMLGLRVRRLLPPHGAVDQPMTLHYELVNRKRLLPCFSLVIEEVDANVRLRGRPMAFCLHVGPLTTGRADAVTWPVQRGRVRFNRIRVSTTFPFGIIRKCILLEQPAHAVIHPKIHRLDRSLLARIHARDLDGIRATQESDGSEEFFGLREYRAGDSLRYIHWRHSARIGRLVSREMTRLSPPRLMVVLNLRRRPGADADPPAQRAYHDDVEQAISFAASLIQAGHEANDEVGLTVLGARCPPFTPQHSRWHLLRMLHALGELRPEDGSPNGVALPQVREARWIAIHAGRPDSAVAPAQAVHLTAADLDRYRVGRPSHDSARPTTNGHDARPRGAKAKQPSDPAPRGSGEQASVP